MAKKLNSCFSSGDKTEEQRVIEEKRVIEGKRVIQKRVIEEESD